MVHFSVERRPVAKAERLARLRLVVNHRKITTRGVNETQKEAISAYATYPLLR